MTLQLVGPSLLEVWTTDGLLGLIENTAENYAAWVECCCVRCVCACQPLQDIYDAAGTLNALFSFPSPECSNGDVGKTMNIGSKGTNQPSSLSCVSFGLVDSAFSNFSPNLQVDLHCTEDGIELIVTDDDPSNCTFGTVTLISETCDEDTFEFVFEIEIIDGPAPLDPCGACDGQVVTVTITPS